MSPGTKAFIGTLFAMVGVVTLGAMGGAHMGWWGSQTMLTDSTTYKGLNLIWTDGQLLRNIVAITALVFMLVGVIFVGVAAYQQSNPSSRAKRKAAEEEAFFRKQRGGQAEKKFLYTGEISPVYKEKEAAMKLAGQL